MVLHELTHSVAQFTFDDFFSNKGNNLNASSRQAVEGLRNNALQFAELMLKYPEAAKLLSALRGTNFNVDTAYSIAQNNRVKSAIASATNIAYVFNEMPKLVNEGKLTEAELYKAQTDTLKEFVAYSLSDSNTLNVLYLSLIHI